MNIRLKNKTLKTGLAILLAGLFFAIIPAPSESHASDRVPLEPDSAIIARHLWEIAVENAIEEFSEHSFNAHLSKAELDSILWADQRMRIVNSEMSWSPDSAFRICTIQLEFCGAYCNPSWVSWLHFNDGSGLVINDAIFDEILHIEIMRDGKYLVIGRSYGRSGTYSCRTDAATLFSIDNYKIQYHTIQDPEKNQAYNEYRFSVGTCSYTGIDCRLTYDKTKQELSYSYAEDAGYVSIPDSVTIYEGILSYVDSAFVAKKTEQRRIKFVEPE